ncbi:MAG: hypothetical protein ACYC1M_18095 [Armatimonadota bacterium]
MSFRDRLSRIVTLTAAVSCCGLLVATIVEAQTPSGSDQTVNLKLIDADLRTAINMLMQQSGASIIFEPSDKPYGQVAVNLNNVPLDRALEYIARSAGAQVVKLDDGTYVVGPKQAISTSAPQVQAAILQSVPERHRTEKIRVQYSRPSDLLGAMGVVGRAGDTSTRNNDTFLRMLQGVNQQVISKPEALINVPNPFMNNDEESANMSETPDSGLNQFGGSNRGGNQGGGFGGRGGNTGGMGGNTGSRGGMGGINQAGGTTGMGGMMGGGTTGMGGATGGQISFPGLEGVGEEIAALDIDNSLVVTGDEDFINSVRKRIRLLDVPQQQVEVKAEFVTISLSETKRLGIDWLVQQVNTQAGTTPGTFANSAAPVFIKYATGNLVTELRAMLTNSKGRVSQAPIITTLNNVPAQVGTQTDYPVWVAQVQSGNTGPNVTTYDIQNYTTDTSMTVQPTILGDGRILINLPLQVEDVPEFKKGPDGTEAPVTTRQYVEATRIVNSGETVVIGGFVRRSDSRSTGKIPLLSDLPWIGSLFRSQSNETADNELLIFLTARILDDSNGPLASSVTP